MDMRSSSRGALEITSEPINGDVVADDILVRVDAVQEPASCTSKTTSERVVVVDDLIRGSFDGVGGCEVEGHVRHVRLGGLLGAAGDSVDFTGQKGAGGRQGGEREGSEGSLHHCGGLGGVWGCESCEIEQRKKLRLVGTTVQGVEGAVRFRGGTRLLLIHSSLIPSRAAHPLDSDKGRLPNDTSAPTCPSHQIQRAASTTVIAQELLPSQDSLRAASDSQNLEHTPSLA